MHADWLELLDLAQFAVRLPAGAPIHAIATVAGARTRKFLSHHSERA